MLYLTMVQAQEISHDSSTLSDTYLHVHLKGFANLYIVLVYGVAHLFNLHVLCH